MKPPRRALYGLMLAALLVRLAALPWFAQVELRIYDEREYDEIGASLAESGEFAMHGRRTSVRPPLFPALVGMVYRVFGTHDRQAVRLLQIVLNVAIVPVVFALGRRIYDERTGLWAAGLAAFYPSLWGHDYLLLTEVSFTLLLCGGMLALMEFSARPRWGPIAAAGALFGLATLTRTSLFLYPALLAIAVFALWRAATARRIAAVAVFVGSFALVVAPWIARNTRLHGRLSPIDSLSGATVARHSPLVRLVGEPGSERGHRARSRPAAEGSARPRTETSARPDHAAAGAEQPSLGGRIARASRDIVRDAFLFWQIDRELVGAAARGWLGPIPRPVVLVLAVFVGGYYVALVLAGAAGLVLRPPENRLQLGLVLSVIATLAGVHALSYGHSRYHIPLMPLLSVFAARLLVTRSEPIARQRLAAALAVTAVLVGSWVTNFARLDLPDLKRLLGSDAGAADGAPRRSEHSDSLLGPPSAG